MSSIKPELLIWWGKPRNQATTEVSMSDHERHHIDVIELLTICVVCSFISKYTCTIFNSISLLCPIIFSAEVFNVP